VADEVVDGVMVSADNVVQCGQATVQWIGTTVYLPFHAFALSSQHTLSANNVPLSRHVVTYRILSPNLINPFIYTRC
jgi:hypothetical protein